MVSLLVFFVVLESATMAFTSSASVNIWSQIAADPPLQVHCKLGNLVDVIAEQTVANGEHVRWGFKPNFWGTTTYACDFKWGARTQVFAVWVDDFFLSIWLKRPCQHCLWIVSPDGFTRYEEGAATGEFVHQWK
jgi:hypothetical protein